MSSNLRLSQEQIQTLKTQGADFKKWIGTENGEKDIQGHREHEHYFKEKLSPENLSKMTENEFAEIWKKTWASPHVG